MNGVKAEDFPERKEFEGEFAEIPAGIFARFIPRVLHAVGNDESRYSLNGAKLELTGERIRMVGTDGHRLALVKRDAHFSAELDVLVPRKSLAELAKLCADFGGLMQIGKTDNHLHFKLGKREVVSCLLSGQYPDYANVLPKENHNRFTVGRDAIHPAIKRVALMADDKQHAIKLEIGDCKLHVSSQTADIGEAGETIIVGYDGQPITAGFNAMYLNDFLNAIEEDEILFEFKTGDTQARLSTVTSNCDRCSVIVMPMRLS